MSIDTTKLGCCANCSQTLTIMVQEVLRFKLFIDGSFPSLQTIKTILHLNSLHLAGLCHPFMHRIFRPL